MGNKDAFTHGNLGETQYMKKRNEIGRIVLTELLEEVVPTNM
jgi:hypothetical protein